MDSFCVKCRKRTTDINPVIKISKNGRHMQQSTCSVCKIKKTKFIKK